MPAVDFPYAAAYTSLLVSIFLVFRSNRRFTGALSRAGIAASALAGLSDYLENTLILLVLSALPQESQTAPVLGAITTLKWIAVATALLVLVVRGMVSLASVVSSKSRSHRGTT